ncbi:MAG: DUF445 domain-containing protein [Acidimicrobiia bacterium]|nr:DUF445 domain-containing protein [Acidimicrobiia bacterium]
MIATVAADRRRAVDLRRMKTRATMLLVATTAAFLVLRVGGADGWRGYAIASAEAAMVGGLADWFAVTALFRHPLRIPIPHTAIIPTRKDQIGESLGDFVQQNFLDGDVLADRVAAAHIGRRAADWLAAPEHAARVARQLADAVVGAIELLDDDVVLDALQSLLRGRLQRTPAAPVLARALDAAVESSQHQVALDAVLGGLQRSIDDNADLFRQRLAEESPWWVPETIDDRIFERIVIGIRNTIEAVRADPDHPLRAHLEERLRELAARLRTDADLQRRVDEVRDEVLEREDLRGWIQRFWSELEADLRAAIEAPESTLLPRIEAEVTRVAERLRRDTRLQARIDDYATRAARYLAQQSGGEVADLIATTVARWDADDTSRRIELHVGRDLQYIRINGTVVGGLAGLVIHAVGEVIA